MTHTQMALMMGCKPRDILTVERRCRNNPYTAAFFAVLNDAPYEVKVCLLTSNLALRREPILSEEEVEKLKNIARGSLAAETYITWYEAFLRRLASRRKGDPYRDYSQNYVRRQTHFKIRSCHMALVLGADPSQVSKAKNHERGHPYVFAFTTILRGCPQIVMKSLLGAYLCFRQARLHTDAEVLQIKKIAKHFLHQGGAYGAWEEKFDHMHCCRRANTSSIVLLQPSSGQL